MEHWINDIEKGKGGKTFSDTLSTANPTWAGLAMNPVLHDYRQTANCLSLI